MTRVAEACQVASSQPALTLYSPPAPETHVAHWRINGYRAMILIWTAEEWALLPVRPDDAQYYPCGVWCALRVI
jgi:hypothetical protein